jgi:fatty-acyl-CoA synthase
MRRDDNDDPSYVGEVLPGLSVEIVDPVSRVPLPDGEVGLVRARSETMSHEYLGNPAATAESWKDGWFYSGDLGRLENNKLFLAGRTSEVINDGGGKIDPIIIDAHFDDEQAFDDHAAFAVHMPNGLDRVGLAYVARGDVDLSPVMKRADDALKFHAPAVYMPVSEIPRNELGKPMRNQLTQQFAETNSHEG